MNTLTNILEIELESDEAEEQMPLRTKWLSRRPFKA